MIYSITCYVWYIMQNILCIFYNNDIWLTTIWKHRIGDLMFIEAMSTTIFEGGQKPKAPAPVTLNELPKASRLFFSNEKNQISLWSGTFGASWVDQCFWMIFLGGISFLQTKKTRWLGGGFKYCEAALRLLSQPHYWKVGKYFLFSPPIWGRFPFWLTFFRWVETTN